MSGLKKPIAKPTKKATPNSAVAPLDRAKAFKSAEFVQDSDDDEDEATNGTVDTSDAITKGKHNGLPTAKKGLSLNGKPSLSKPTTKRKSIAAREAAAGSEVDSVSERSSDSDGEGVNGTKVAKDTLSTEQTLLTGKPPQNGNSPSLSVTSTGSSDDEKEGYSNHAPAKRRKLSPPSIPIVTNAKQTALRVEPAPDPTTSAPRPEDNETSESENEEDVEMEQNGESASGSESESGNESDEVTTPSKTMKSNSEPSILLYTPPPGFEPATISSHASASQRKLFSPSNLQGKQLWHIRIPSSIPISSLVSISKQSVQDGSSVLSHKGTNYSLTAPVDNQAKSSIVLLPSDEGSKYKPASAQIATTLHLRHLIDLPSISHNVGAQDAGTQVGGTINVRKPYAKMVPQQPEGLRMRYRPIGVSDSDDPDAGRRLRKPQNTKAPEFHVPALLSSGQSPKKPKGDEPGAVGADARADSSQRKKATKIAVDKESGGNGMSDSTVAPAPQKSKTTMNTEKSIDLEKNSKGLRPAVPPEKGRSPSKLPEMSPVPIKSTKKRKKFRSGNDDLESTEINNAPKAESTAVGPSTKPLPVALEKDVQSASMVNGIKTSPVRSMEKKRKHLTDDSASEDKDRLSHTITNGHTTPSSPTKAVTPVAPLTDSQTSPPKKKRRKHKSLPTTEENNPAVTPAKDTSKQAETPITKEEPSKPKVQPKSTTEIQAPKKEPPKPKSQSAKATSKQVETPAPKPVPKIPTRAPILPTLNGKPLLPEYLKSESASIRSSSPAVDKKKQLSTKSKIPGETKEERRARRAEKMRRKDERAALNGGR